MPRVKITDISKDEMVSKEDLKRVLGGSGSASVGENLANTFLSVKNLVVWDEQSDSIASEIKKSVADL